MGNIRIRYLAATLLLAAMLLSMPSAIASPPSGAGAGKASLWNSNSYACATGATDFSDGPYGFVVMNTNAHGDLIIEVSLKGATPHTTYDVWVNQDPGACPLGSPTAPGALTTNGQGNGNAHIKLPRLASAANFWVSVVGGSLVLRSTAVAL